VIEHFRTEDGRVAVRETGDKIKILDQDHDSVALALERAVERFGGYLHFDGNQAGTRNLVDIVVTHDLADDPFLDRNFLDFIQGQLIVSPIV
jgi:hypothetical protein